MTLRETLDKKVGKKASLGIITAIIVVLVSCLLIYNVSFNFFKTLDGGTQDLICTADLMVSNSILNKEAKTTRFWFPSVKDKALEALDATQRLAAKTRLESPFCTTHEKILDIDILKKEKKYKNYLDSEIISIEIGEMIEGCWKTFGEGEIINTFGQGKEVVGNDDVRNFYFPCYAFKFKSTNKEFKEDGFPSAYIYQMLWLYNLKGQKLPNLKEIKTIEDGETKGGEVVQESIKKYLDGDKDYMSYGAYIYLEHPGYLEFMETVKGGSPRWTSVNAQEHLNAAAVVANVGVASGIVTGMLVGGVSNAWNPVGWVLIGAGVIGAIGIGIAGVANARYRGMNPDIGTPLTNINSDQWYEVRYYSPYVEESSEYLDGYILNNIKIMPYDGYSEGNDASNR